MVRYSLKCRCTKRLPHRCLTEIEEHSTRMVRIFHPLLFLLARSTADDLQKQIEFLKAENEMLRKRVPKKQIFLEPAEKTTLLKLGKELGPAIRYLITIVSYSTFRRWVRKEEGKGPTRKGRPRLAAIVRELIVMIAKETGWGCDRSGKMPTWRPRTVRH